ncbi:type IV pilus biogenesis protein PilM [Vibrio salinus]|uniref:type IV pilus biogenesis protein PilM n=1 Tax=Vibrio salinus TaxID=2899784 RepID=UPI001E51C63B|nr:pilus assembly protein PilM [Vibrio salinus]MCE0493961.1 pilus assembly protein PilM [Vibrio salinus]
MGKRIITGIDIRCNSILAITVAKKYDIYQIQMIQDISLKDNIEVRNINSYHQIIVSVLKKIKQKLPKSSSHTVFSLPDSEVIVKEIELPATDALFRPELLLQQFARDIPVPVDELVVDYICEQNRYHVFATRKEGVLIRKNIARNAGLTLGLIDFEKQAFLQSLCYLKEVFPEKTSILIDIGTHYLRIGALLNKNQSLFRAIEIPAGSLRSQTMIPEFVAEEWKRAASFYSSEFLSESVFVCLSPDYPSEIFTILAEKMPCHCVRVESLQHFPSVPGLDLMINEPFIAIGNALRGFHSIEKNKYAA